jgi:secreted trypsin-like serine protease
MHTKVYNLALVTGAFALAAAFALSASAEGMKGPKTPYDLAKERLGSADPSHQKVYGGKDAPPGAFPFQVSLLQAEAKKGDEFNYHFCGGSLIADTWVLTAGHCVTSEGEILDPTRINVYVGSTDFKNGDRIAVKSVYRHPQYNADFTDNDVALLKLERAPKKEVKVGKINLIDATKDSTLETPGTDLTIVGWGTTEQGSLSRTLRYTSVKIVDRTECNNNILQNRATSLDDSLSGIVRSFRIPDDKVSAIRQSILDNAGQIVNENMICAGDPKPDPAAQFVHDTCQGDSGGPLVAKSTDKATQVGIVSWGEGCGVPKLHGVYTRLGKFMDWVKSTATN